MKIRLNELFGNATSEGKYTKMRLFDSEEEKEEYIKSVLEEKEAEKNS